MVLVQSKAINLKGIFGSKPELTEYVDIFETCGMGIFLSVECMVFIL